MIVANITCHGWANQKGKLAMNCLRSPFKTESDVIEQSQLMTILVAESNLIHTHTHTHKQLPLFSRIMLFVTVRWTPSDSTTRILMTPTVKEMLMLLLLWISFNEQYVSINLIYTIYILRAHYVIPSSISYS
jgi:hypothetical protein